TDPGRARPARRRVPAVVDQARGRQDRRAGDRSGPARAGRAGRQPDDPGRGTVRAPRQLAVLLGGEHVAMVERTRSTLRLTYLEHVRRPDVTPLSLALPPLLGTHSGAPVEAYLDGLVPDSDGALAALKNQYGVDTKDQLSSLAAIGTDCAGAVQLCLPEEIERLQACEGELVPVSAAEIEQRLAEMGVDEDACWILPGEHWALGGSQQEFALPWQAGSHPADGADPLTQIVKP